MSLPTNTMVQPRWRFGMASDIKANAMGSIPPTPRPMMKQVTRFIMGLGVGGMLPIAFALMSEAIPKRHRGWTMVLVGSDIAGAYIIVSWLATTWASPTHFGWRLLWLI